MRNVLMIILSLIATTSSVAHAGLPDWALGAAKNAAFDQFIEWLAKEAKFYKISRVDTREITIPSGGEAAEVTIWFDDASGCKERQHTATCIPMDTELGCFHSLSGCSSGHSFRAYQRVTPNRN